MDDALRQPSADRGNLVVRQIFMAGHIRPRNSEADDPRQCVVPHRATSIGRQVAPGNCRKNRRQAMKLRMPLQPGRPVARMTRGAILLKQLRTTGHICLRNRSRRQVPLALRCPMTRNIASTQTSKISDKVITAPTTEKIRIRWHERTGTQLCRLLLMSLQPERRAAASHFRKIRPLPAIADQRRLQTPQRFH